MEHMAYVHLVLGEACEACQPPHWAVWPLEEKLPALWKEHLETLEVNWKVEATSAGRGGLMWLPPQVMHVEESSLPARCSIVVLLKRQVHKDRRGHILLVYNKFSRQSRDQADLWTCCSMLTLLRGQPSVQQLHPCALSHTNSHCRDYFGAADNLPESSAQV